MENDMKIRNTSYEVGFIVGLLIVLVAGLIFLPLLVIWSLNTLFPQLAIAYGLAEWFSVLVLTYIVGGRGVQISKKNG